MPLRRLAALSAAAFGLCAVSAAAFELSAARALAGDLADPPPVKIEGCVVSSSVVMVNAKVGVRMPSVSGVRITYTNERDIPATEIRFRIKYQGTTTRAVDRGSFAPGSRISRDFTGVSATYNSDSADCTADEVTFSDGTQWNASGGTPAQR